MGFIGGGVTYVIIFIALYIVTGVIGCGGRADAVFLRRQGGQLAWNLFVYLGMAAGAAALVGRFLSRSTVLRTPSEAGLRLPLRVGPDRARVSRRRRRLKADGINVDGMTWQGCDDRCEPTRIRLARSTSAPFLRCRPRSLHARPRDQGGGNHIGPDQWTKLRQRSAMRIGRREDPACPAYGDRAAVAHLIRRATCGACRPLTIATLGIAWIACCAMPCIGQASNPGPWLVPSRPTALPTRTYSRPDQADDRDGWSCDEDDDCGAPFHEGDTTAGPPSEDELVDMDSTEAQYDGVGRAHAAGRENDFSVDVVRGADDGVDACDRGTSGRDPSGIQGSDDFIPSTRFDGRRDGMVFRVGHRGLGYYRDSGGHAPSAHAPVLCLDELVPRSADGRRTNTEAALRRDEVDDVERDRQHGRPPGCEYHGERMPSLARRQRRARRRRPAAGYVIKETMDCAEVDWRRAGYWAVDTVNPNSWKGAMGYLERTAADAVLIQETRRLGAQVQSAEREAMHNGWRASLRAAEQTEADGTTAGLAIATRRHIGLANLGGTEHGGGGSPSARVHAKWMGGMVRGGVHLLTTWPHHTEGPSPRNLDVLDDLARIISSIKGPWLAGADWNMSAAALAATGWLDMVDGVAIVPEVCTCEASCIDYFVVHRSMLHMVAGISVIEDAGLHPHKPVRLFLRADARSLKVRRLRKPASFPKGGGPPGCLPEAATCPMGVPRPLAEQDGGLRQHVHPHLRPRNPPQRDDGGRTRRERSSYADWIRQVEVELADIYGITGDDERARHGGRENGPKFVWECALGQQRPVPRYSSGASIRWRTIAQCARDLARDDAMREEGNVASSTVARTAQRALRKLTAIVGEGSPTEPAVAAAAALLSETGSAPRRAIAETARQAAIKLERDLAAVRDKEWRRWIAGEGSGALGRQHRFSRTQMGWIPSKVGIAPVSILTKLDRADGGDGDGQQLHQQRVAEAAPDDGRASSGRILRQAALGLAPMGIQEVVEDQAILWGEHWAVRQGLPKPQWPDGIGDVQLERPTVQQLRAALKSFPAGTALAWDALHPRALLRLGDARLEELIDVLVKAEVDGEWPEEIGTVSIVLLPKPDGGWRPIGLFPAVVRVWMRLRRDAAQQWEKDHSRDYFYAGQGRGAQVAAWQHAQRAEMASTAGATFVQLLLDMQKCFEVVPHHILAREAHAVGYPLPLLRLALAAYRLPRALAVGGVHSSVIEAERGIAAGSGLATTELRVLLIRLLDRVRRIHPDVRLSAYVDDLTADAAGTTRTAPQRVAEAGRELCEGIIGLGLRLSIGKCKVLASSAAAGQQAARDLSAWGVRFVANAKALGVGVAGGARRVTVVQKQRWKALCGRLHRLAILSKYGVSVANLFRTGVSAAFTYGDDVIGVADDVLERRRRTVAAAVSAGAQGKSVDAVLALADDRPDQSLDPAYDAHKLPIGRWAEAMFSRWAKREAMEDTMRRERARLAKARRPWGAVRGPAGAVLATAERINWRFVDARRLVTDTGRTLDLTADPPCVVVREVHDAVARWRWKRLCLSAGCPGGDDHDGGLLCLNVARRMLRPASRSKVWTAAHQAALRSALVNGQWPQHRLYKAGMVDTPFCQLCALCGVPREGAGEHLVMAEPPMGTTFHRLATCVITAATVDNEFPSVAVERAVTSAFIREAVGMMVHGDADLINQDAELLADAAGYAAGRPRAQHDRRPRPVHWLLGGAAFIRQALKGVTRAQFVEAWEATKGMAAAASAWARAMIPSAPNVRQQGVDWHEDDEGTFQWVLRPPSRELPLLATFYTDGSAYDGYSRRLRCFGWSFAAVDASGAVVAMANGTPPPWVESVAAAEAWALLQASRAASPGAVFKTDCLAVMKMIRGGVARATAPSRPMARVASMLLTSFDDDDAAMTVIWMPAHSSTSDVGRAVLSDGSRLTELDVRINARADALAKAAARSRRAAPEVRAAHVATYALARRYVCHLGRMTHAANNFGQPPVRDSQPVPPRLRRKLPKRELDARPPRLGGHVLVPRLAGGWSCQVCRGFAKCKANIAHRMCKGDVLARWAQREATMARDGITFATSHVLRLLGDVVWCTRCAAYGTEKAVGLAAPCRGPPPRGADWGRHTKLMRLRRGLHPKTGARIALTSWPRCEEIIRAAETEEQQVLAERFRGQLGVDQRGSSASSSGSNSRGGPGMDIDYAVMSSGDADAMNYAPEEQQDVAVDQPRGHLAHVLARIRMRIGGRCGAADSDNEEGAAVRPPPKMRRVEADTVLHVAVEAREGLPPCEDPHYIAACVGTGTSSTARLPLGSGQAAGHGSRDGLNGGVANDTCEFVVATRVSPRAQNECSAKRRRVSGHGYWSRPSGGEIDEVLQRIVGRGEPSTFASVGHDARHRQTCLRKSSG